MPEITAKLSMPSELLTYGSWCVQFGHKEADGFHAKISLLIKADVHSVTSMPS